MTAEDVRRKGVAFWVCKGVLKEQKPVVVLVSGSDGGDLISTGLMDDNRSLRGLTD